jgi:hypothetical protein
LKQRLKLKQASAVLQIRPKELQNLVQFGVVKPQRAEGTYFFDAKALLAAKVAFRLKEYLGTRTEVLSNLMAAFSRSEPAFKSINPEYVVFTWGRSVGADSLKLGVPFRALAKQIDERMRQADLYKDLPPGRKRRGWKREFLKTLAHSARDIGEVSEVDILRTVRTYRRERRAPNITVAAEK